MSGAKIISFLDRLEDLIPSLPVEDVPGLIESLITVGDELDRSHENAPGNLFGMPVMIDRSVIRLLARLDTQQRESILTKAIAKAQGVSTPAHVVAHYTAEQGKHGESPLPEAERTFGGEATQRLTIAVLQRIRKAADDDTLLHVPNLAYVLHRWLDWAGADEPRKWVGEIIKDSDERLAKILNALAQKHYSQSLRDYIGRTTLRLNPRWLEPFLDPGEIVDRVRKLSDTDQMAAQFMREYNLLESGEDPDDFRRDWE